MTRITVNVQGDVQKHRLMCLTKWHDPADEVNVRAAHDGEVPEFVSTSDLSDGDKVIINITGNPTWDVEAGEDLPAGIPVACGEDGVVVATSPSYARLIGYTANAASAGSVVKVVKQFIVNRNWLDGVEETDSEPRVEEMEKTRLNR
ncbi:head fiber protein [Geomicrobium sp. JCM 19037]|uniref:head fiber protein n=1 Tax=Geomicrobium sp. JCM 19037 TaxID=1460634 RepID=UPI0005A77D52|nr:head fiber protein [Geomicrobium sp. JCM 19037]